MKEKSLRGLKNYFTKGWNILDMIQLLSTATITILNLPQGGSSNKKNERIAAAFSLFFIWIKFFDWLKLFDTTAFYIELLKRTIIDVLGFIVLFGVTLAMFGSSMLML